ncbi:hypothetical protein D3C72_1105100 [compost metagenome]
MQLLVFQYFGRVVGLPLSEAVVDGGDELGDHLPADLAHPSRLALVPFLEAQVKLDERVIWRCLRAFHQHVEPQIRGPADRLEPRALVHKLLRAANPLVAVGRHSPDLDWLATLIHVTGLGQGHGRHIEVTLHGVVVVESRHVAECADNSRDGLRTQEANAPERGENGVGLQGLGHGRLVGVQLGLEMTKFGNQQLQALGIQRAIHPARLLGELHEGTYGLLGNARTTEAFPQRLEAGFRH